MPSTVKVPLLGQHSKGTVVGVTIGGFAVAGYMIYRYKAKAKSQAAAVSASDSAASAASGYGYGSSYGYGQGIYPGGYYGYGEPGVGGGGTYYGYGVPLSQNPGPVANTTNAQWAQAAINQLTQEGYDAQTVSAALGAYELGQPVSDSQKTIIQSAIGIEGYPPQAGSNGYPPAIKSQGGGGDGQGGKITIPDVVGEPYSSASVKIRAAGLVPHRATKFVGKVLSEQPAAGSQVAKGTSVTLQGREKPR